ncbi:MAG TPA: DoxX family membrane protein, partial [Blastocatellia bacterium]|nr:DoxX family membrane protein [Blastocatellia bacterium]
MRGSSLLALTALFAPVSAYAHVKWFADYDIASPPRPLIDVFLGEYFLAFIVILVPLMFAVAYLDRYLARANCLLYRLCDRLTESVSGYFSVILRLGVGVFFTALFSYGEFILTPELKSQEAWVRWVQLAIAIFSLTRQSAWLAGAGIFLLYGFALVMYGFFHLSDYPIFLGVAIYLIIDSYYRSGKPELAQTVMRVATGITLLWASIEKFAYPEWSFLLLSERPALSMGFNPEFYMVAAGFVEFCAAFLLVTGMLSSRAAALVLLFFFVSAIVPFGMIDAIGHSVIIIVLALIAMSHNPVARRFD